MKWAFIILLFIILEAGAWVGGYFIDRDGAKYWEGYIKDQNELVKFQIDYWDQVTKMDGTRLTRWEKVADTGIIQYTVHANEFPTGSENWSVYGRVALPIYLFVAFWWIVLAIIFGDN